MDILCRKKHSSPCILNFLCYLNKHKMFCSGGNIMPVNKNQWERLQAILGIMRKNLLVNYRSFMEEMLSKPDFYISPRTFTRDIKKLGELGAPIKYHPRKKGFYLTVRNWDMSFPTKAENMKMLLLSEQIARNFLPSPMRDDLRRAVDYILRSSDINISSHTSIGEFQIIAPDFSPKVDYEIFKTVYQAWEELGYLKINYYSPEGESSQKIIIPRLFAWDSGCWYTKGYVVKENDISLPPPWDIRVFALHRIREAEITPGRYSPDTSDCLVFRKAGFFNLPRFREVEIEFFQPEAQRIKERFASDSDAVAAQSENSITVRLKYVSEHTVFQLIGLAMGNARIIKPVELLEPLRSIAQKILDNMK